MSWQIDYGDLNEGSPDEPLIHARLRAAACGAVLREGDAEGANASF